VIGTIAELSGRRADGSYHKRDDHDFYIEPEWTVDVLLDAEDFTGTVYDPACGSGTIPRVCCRRGLTAFGADLINRGPSIAPVNFLSDQLPITGIQNIICNPPYRDAEKFVRRALAVVGGRGKVAMLVQSKFLFSQKRWQLFNDDPPARIYFLSTRPSMPPGAEYLRGEVEAKNGKVDYVWMVWPTYMGVGRHTQCHWLLKGNS
jgi:hypothetical protein